MSKKPQIYFSSDWHMSHDTVWTNKDGEKCHRGIITFERTQFKTIQEHDEFIRDMILDWGDNWAPGSKLYFLGDFGDLKWLWLFNYLREKDITVAFLAGNHDKEEDFDTIKHYVDEFYQYPIYLSKKFVISHEPVAIWGDTVNVSGHLHGSIIDSPNYINASVHVANYKPITLKQVNNKFSELPKYTRHFLYEPWAKDYKFTQKKEDVVMDKNGRIDLSASRLLQKLNAEKRIENGEPYRPYTGTFCNK